MEWVLLFSGRDLTRASNGVGVAVLRQRTNELAMEWVLFSGRELTRASNGVGAVLRQRTN